MSRISNKEVLLRPLNKNNPATMQMLGICSALAVTAQLKSALVMALSVTVVVTFANVIISLLRNAVPSRIRIVVQLMAVAALVTIVNGTPKAYVYDVSKGLSVYIGLIVMNCTLTDRLKAFVLTHSPKASFLDGIGDGLGYGLVLVIIGSIRELSGKGLLLGFQIIPWACYDMGYVNHGLMIMPPMTLTVLACIVWMQRNKLKDLQKKWPPPTPHNLTHFIDKV